MRFILLLIFWCQLMPCSAQHKLQFLESTLESGMIVKNYPRFPSRDPSLKLSVNIGKKLSGYQPWHKSYGCPEFGFKITTGNLGNDDVLGFVVGAMPCMNFTIPHSDELNYSISTGLGVAYFTKKYNEINNNTNILIGSNVTAFAYAGVGITKSINDKIDGLIRLSVYHASNGHTQLPNVGLNLICLSAGIHRNSNSPTSTKIIKVDTPFAKQNGVNIKFGYGFNERGNSTGPVGGSKYSIYTSSVSIFRRYSSIGRVYGGVDYCFNDNYYKYIKDSSYYSHNISWKASTVSFFLAHEFIIGHLALYTQGGIYIHNPFYRDQFNAMEEKEDIRGFLKTLFPSRIGFNYYIKNSYGVNKTNMFVGTYIKANFGQADFLEFVMGLSF